MAHLDLWDRLARLHESCDVELSSATHQAGNGELATVWTISIRHQGNGLPVSLQADSMLDALLDGLIEAESRRWLP